jgi:hypothetical protein
VLFSTIAVVLAAGITWFPSGANAQATTPPVKPQPPTPTTRPAARPSATAGPSRGFATFGAGGQIASTDFSESHSEPLNGEQKTWTANYNLKSGVEFEIGAGWRIWHNLFAGATYSRFHDSRKADVSAEIPHPFFFNQPRRISGETSALAHDENGGHISLSWIVPVGRRLEVGVFGGPSFINVSRQLVKDVEYGDTYPYDTASFSQATVERVGKTSVGAHGGVDVTWFLSRQVGVGGLVRYSRASVDLSTPAGGTISFDVGGLQAAAIVRVRVLGKEPPRPPTTQTPTRNLPGSGMAASDAPLLPTAVTTASAPVFLRPDPSLAPLRQLPAGTRLRVLDQTNDWVHVEFEDRQYGRRVGYIQKAFVRVETGR